MESFIGQIQPFALNFVPREYASCDGQLLAISQNDALFSLLGTTYGGDGRTTFGLPDLRGRSMMGQGNGPGLTTRVLGQEIGVERVTLTVGELPSHNHSLVLKASSSTGSSATPTDRKNVLSVASSGNLYGSSTPNVLLNSGNGAALGNTGGSMSHENMSPYLAITICIVLFGIYPSRS